jgi:hypothetical protein
MFSPEIVESEEFLTMPVSSQALYFHLGMNADDDGFVQPKLVMKLLGANEDDLKVLLSKRFLLPFETGVVVIKHWLIHNMIRSDRYKPTRFQVEKRLLLIKENNAYTEKKSTGCQNDNQLAPQVRLGKVRLGKVKTECFAPPSLDQVSIYITSKGYTIDPEEFFDKHTANGWTLKNGKKIVDWQAVVRTWARFRKKWEEPKYEDIYDEISDRLYKILQKDNKAKIGDFLVWQLYDEFVTYHNQRSEEFLTEIVQKLSKNQNFLTKLRQYVPNEKNS